MDRFIRLRPILGVAVIGLLVPVGCTARRADTGPDVAARGQLFPDMGNHHRQITTSSREAQKYFDQGLTWAFAFNHDEAIRSFTRAAELDPQCAMAWWGVALCHGPHINNPVVPPERSKAAWDAVQKAQALFAAGASPVERRLIEAVSKRYANPAPADRRALDEAYADAMQAVWREFPSDTDVGSLYAESLMDLQPWDVWTHDGAPKGRATEILAVLQDVQRRDPHHPGANHLYIHAVEAGPHPEDGLAAADSLRNAVPIAGHLVHMPSHIYVQVGRWADAADQNTQAIKADARYRGLSPRQDFYRVYMAHNQQFLAFASMMEGRYAAALRAAQGMVGSIPEDYKRENAALVDPFLSIVLDVQMRFGKWDELLAAPAPPDFLPIYTAMWRFMRGVAFAAKGQVDDARQEQARFRSAADRVPADAMMAINPAHKVLGIADKVLEAEIAYRTGNIDAAVTVLQAAVVEEDSLLYMEPPEWMHPVRHILGAYLLDAGRVAEAESVYREDLKNWPENGWSLHGLAECCRKSGDSAGLADAERRFAKTWHRADTPIAASCLCATAGK